MLSPPRPEIPPSFWEQYGLWALLLAIPALALLTWLAWLLFRPKPAVPIPIEVQTRSELESLARLPEDGAILSRISRCMRRYIAIAFDLPSDELTTAELCGFIERNDHIGPALATQLTAFFRTCDDQKFAPDSRVREGNARAALALLQTAEERRTELKRQAVSAPPSHP